MQEHHDVGILIYVAAIPKVLKALKPEMYRERHEVTMSDAKLNEEIQRLIDELGGNAVERQVFVKTPTVPRGMWPLGRLQLPRGSFLP